MCMKKIDFLVFRLVIIALVFFSMISGTTLASENNKLTIVTSFYPLKYFASEIAGNTAKVINIGANNDPHAFTPSAKDIMTMQDANLVLLQGAGFESWGEDLEHQLKNADTPVYVVAEHLKLHKTNESDEQHEDALDTHKEEQHHHGGYDPHTWLSPVLAAQTVEGISAKLSVINPTQASLYKQNANKLIEKLNTLDVEYRQQLDPAKCSASVALISHDALGYIAHRYNLTMHPIAGISTQDKPSAKLLVGLKKLVKKEGVVAVLTEENSVKKYAQTIANETGIMMLQINVLATGVVDGDYMSGMRSNLENLKKAYGCAK